MLKKSKTNDEFLTRKEFIETKKEFIKRFERIEKNMATKDDLKNFATKDDLKNFATKDDLKNFATKDDLKNFATKDDLKNFATKDDIKNMATKDDIERLAKEIIKHSEDIEYIKRTMAKDEDIQRIINTLDVLIGKTEDHERKAIINTHRINEIESKLEGHEKRISALESRSST